MEKKKKSIKDIWNQAERCRERYHTFDNTKPHTKWLGKAAKIKKIYMDNIASYFSLTADISKIQNIQFPHWMRARGHSTFYHKIGGRIFAFKYTEECPANYYVYPISRKMFNHPCCVPLCQDTVPNKYFLFIRVPSERIASTIMKEAQLHKVTATRIHTIINSDFDKKGFRMKSLEMIDEQYASIKQNFPNSHLLPKANKIAEYYKSNISFFIQSNIERYDYATRSFVFDTPLDVIVSLPTKEVKGLYAYDDDGNKIIPTEIYFGSDTRLCRDNGVKCGKAYYHYNHALRPVYLPDGTRFHIDGLANVCCQYKDNIVFGWSKE